MSASLSRYLAVPGKLTLSGRNVDPVEDGIAVAVRVGVLVNSSLHARKLGEMRMGVVAAPKYPPVQATSAGRRARDTISRPGWWVEAGQAAGRAS